MNRHEEAHHHIEREIRREKAEALGRAGERLEAALRDVAAVAARLDSAVDGVVRDRLLDEYETARQRARLARYALLVQREAIGLRHHAAVDQLFPEPPRRRPRRV